MGMNVATTCKPPPSPSASKVISHSGVPKPVNSMAHPIHCHGLHRDVEEVNECPAEIDAEQK